MDYSGISVSVLLILALLPHSNNFYFPFDIVDSEDIIMGKGIVDLSRAYYLANQTHLTIIKSIHRENINKFNDILYSAINNFVEETTFQIEEPAYIVHGNFRRRSQNIFFIDSVDSVKEILKVFDSVNFRIRKIFTVVAVTRLNSTEMEEIFDLFYKIYILNVNIMTFEELNKLHLFTFFPFQLPNCNNTKPKKISSFLRHIEKWSKYNFFNRKANNIRGCPLRIGASVTSAEPAIITKNIKQKNMVISGVAKDIFVELSRRLNFTIIYTHYFNGVGTVLANGTAFGVLGEVLKNNVDVCLGFTSLQYTRTLFLSATTFHTMDPLILVGKLRFL